RAIVWPASMLVAPGAFYIVASIFVAQGQKWAFVTCVLVAVAQLLVIFGLTIVTIVSGSFEAICSAVILLPFAGMLMLLLNSLRRAFPHAQAAAAPRFEVIQLPPRDAA